MKRRRWSWRRGSTSGDQWRNLRASLRRVIPPRAATRRKSPRARATALGRSRSPSPDHEPRCHAPSATTFPRPVPRAAPRTPRTPPGRGGHQRHCPGGIDAEHVHPLGRRRTAHGTASQSPSVEAPPKDIAARRERHRRHPALQYEDPTPPAPASASPSRSSMTVAARRRGGLHRVSHPPRRPFGGGGVREVRAAAYGPIRLVDRDDDLDLDRRVERQREATRQRTGRTHPASAKAVPRSSLAPLTTPGLAGEGGIAGDEADDLDHPE